jgi:hypothetical protein
MAMWQHSVVCMCGVLCGDASWTAYLTFHCFRSNKIHDMRILINFSRPNHHTIKQCGNGGAFFT